MPVDWTADGLLADYRRRVVESYLAEPVAGEAGWRAFRARRDALFQQHPRSALDGEQKRLTPSLPYFPYAPDAVVETTLQPVDPGRDAGGDLRVDTGGEDGVLRLRRIGRLPTPYGALTLFWLLGYGGGLFLPFRDGTSGHETYGGGRYLTDTAKGTFGRGLTLDGTSAVLDLNYAYNPSCAYSSAAACPLAPPENHLTARVEAGELTYPYAR